MSMVEAPIITYIRNDHARPSVVRFMERLAAKTPHSVTQIIRYGEAINCIDTQIKLVIGGDWSVGAAMISMFKKVDIDPKIIIVAPGGTHNGFYETLRSSGAVVTEEDIINQNFPNVKNFRPGILNNSLNNLFHHTCVLGDYAQEFSAEHERIRMNPIWPREWPMFIAFMTTLLNEKWRNYPPHVINLLMTQHRIGYYSIGIDRLVLDSPDLYHLEFDVKKPEELKLKILTLFRQIFDKKRLSEITGLHIGQEFEIESKIKAGNLDGDWRTIEPPNRCSGKREGIIYARKTDRTILTGALVFKSPDVG